MLSISFLMIGYAVAVIFAGDSFVDPYFAGKHDYFGSSGSDDPPSAAEDYFPPSWDSNDESSIRASPTLIPKPVPRRPSPRPPGYRNPVPVPLSYMNPPSYGNPSSNYGYPPPAPSGYGYPQTAPSGYGYPPPASSGYGYPPPASSGYGSPPQSYDSGLSSRRDFSSKSSDKYMIHPGLHKMPFYPTEARTGKIGGKGRKRTHY